MSDLRLFRSGILVKTNLCFALFAVILFLTLSVTANLVDKFSVPLQMKVKKALEASPLV